MQTDIRTRKLTRGIVSSACFVACLALLSFAGCGAASNVVPEGELTAEQQEAIELEDSAVDMAEGG